MMLLLVKKADAWLEQSMSRWPVNSFVRFCAEKLHSRWSARAFFPPKFERINRPTRHVLLQTTILLARPGTRLKSKSFIEVVADLSTFVNKVQVNTNMGKYTTKTQKSKHCIKFARGRHFPKNPYIILGRYPIPTCSILLLNIIRPTQQQHSHYCKIQW